MALSERCVELVFHWLPVAVREPQNLEARYYMSFAAVLGMMAYIPVSYTHLDVYKSQLLFYAKTPYAGITRIR